MRPLPGERGCNSYELGEQINREAGLTSKRRIYTVEDFMEWVETC